ncbi:acyl-CoA thioesterase [Planctomicrobium sp. SH664]|uniref:acyl-CoA thioesterase n=1 Tax=Planctomicrobium sp. SH664 TaxID=3448125 RepID=UPI003F5C05EB
MPLFFHFEHTVAATEIDQQGHANNVAYFQWLQDAAIAHSTLQGWSGEAYRDRNWAWVVRTHFIEYRRPLFAGESIVVKTWVADMKKFTSLRKYQVYRGEQLMARAETNWAFVDLREGRLIAIPPDVAGSFEIGEPRAAEGDA